MPIDPLQYADMYEAVRDQLLPGLFRTGAKPDDQEKMTYAVYTVSYDPRTGQPYPPEVVGINRAGVLAQIEEWRMQIVGLEKKITNTEWFLADADTAPLVENPQ